MIKPGDAKQVALHALDDAYGRTQTTPDGLYCRIGRIDRAYRILKGNNSPIAMKARATIKTMEEDAKNAFVQADRTLASYVRARKFSGQGNDLDAPTCDCAYCSQPAPTINGCANA